jgi:hypothetical protein
VRIFRTLAVAAFLVSSATACGDEPEHLDIDYPCQFLSTDEIKISRR